MTDATAAVSPLRRRMIDDMSLRNLSPATQRSYIHAIKGFARFHGRSPDQPWRIMSLGMRTWAHRF